ncbi:MAG: four helix bundle protein [Candidatus Omnitrophota bacterium]|nr:four helix bundle protein [Candidatus Omnitrophota bacterium]
MSEENKEFDFEKLEVYQLALELLSLLFRIYKSLARDIKFMIGENHIRAGLSISNNIAEGSGKRHKNEKKRFYGISLDSARETISMLNVLKREGFIDDKIYNEMRHLARRITGKLVNLIGSVN